MTPSSRRGSLGRNRRGIAPLILGVIVVVVAVVVVAGGLFAAGVFNPKSSNGGTSANFAITFTETGLLAGASWSVTLGGSAQSSGSTSITFDVANGTYTYTVSATGYTAVPSSGTIVVNGLAISQHIAFTKIATYSIAFSETGLPSGTSWTVTLAGVPQSSATSAITFAQPNGSYVFSVTATDYSAAPASGTVTVNGIDLSIAVAFTSATTYTVTFTETGLGSGTNWSVTLNSVPQSSTGASIAFTGVPSGSYSFAVIASGYTSSPASGTVAVTGASVTETVTFTSSGGGSGESCSQATATATSVASGYRAVDGR